MMMMPHLFLLQLISSSSSSLTNIAGHAVGDDRVIMMLMSAYDDADIDDPNHPPLLPLRLQVLLLLVLHLIKQI